MVDRRNLQIGISQRFDADESIPVPTWTRPQAGKPIPVQKWNSPQDGQVHHVDATAETSADRFRSVVDCIIQSSRRTYTSVEVCDGDDSILCTACPSRCLH